MLIALLAGVAALCADPVTLPVMTITPDYLEPSLITSHSASTLDLELARPIRFGGPSTDPRPVTMLLDSVDTPPQAKADNIRDSPAESEHTCELRATIDRDGRAVVTDVISCETAALARAARRVIAEATFEPGLYDGRPVAVADVPIWVTLEAKR